MIEKQLVGYLEKEHIFEYTIKNKKGNYVKILNLGLAIKSININGHELVLSYEKVFDYIENEDFLGCFVGRFANRIKDGKFTLDGVEYQLLKNENNNHLHGGGLEGKSVSHRVWLTSEIENLEPQTIFFSITSEESDAGYPGEIVIYCKISFLDSDELVIDTRCYPDSKTILNFTNHSYFNMNGLDKDSNILDNELQLFCDGYLEIDDEKIPTGKIIKCKDNPDMDFSEPKLINQDFDKVGIYDHCYLSSSTTGRYDVYHNEYKTDITLNKLAKLKGKAATMELYSTSQALQFYSGNMLKGKKGKDGIILSPNKGLALEPQLVPNAPNLQEFNNCFFSPLKPYHHIILYKFY